MNNEPTLSGHISRRFDHELEAVRNQVLTMGGLVEAQVNDGINCLVDGDSELARQVVKNDYKINRLEVEIDERCVDILARRQPAAGDLRLVVAIIKTITDLERIGDQAEKLGRNQLELVNDGSSSAKFARLEHIGQEVSNLLHHALDAFARMSVDDAIKTIEMDKRVNEEFDSLSRQLITHMMEDPRTIKSALRVSWSARALERIGDHAKNICEYVIFLVQGKDIRHIDDTDEG
ncbi:MAG: phosphate transport system protein [Gammaproteobacteria bacterium]|jgi:phosphate transport system protein